MEMQRFSLPSGLLAGFGVCIGAAGSPAESANGLLFLDVDDEPPQAVALGGHPGAQTTGLSAVKRGNSLFLDVIGSDVDRKAGNDGHVVLSSEHTATATPAWRVNPAEIMLFAVKAARVRSGPGTDFSVITNMVPGQSARVTGVVGDQSWYQVALTNGARGYVHGDLLGKRPRAGAGPRTVNMLQLPPAGRGTPEQERLRAAIIQQVRAVDSQFDLEREILAAMQQRLKQ